MKPLKFTVWSGRFWSFPPPVIPLSAIAASLVLIPGEAAHAATNTVISLADSGAGSLRQTIADSLKGDAIVLGVTGTITLTSGQLVIAKDLTIVGPGSSALTISGNHSRRVLWVDTNVAASISGLTIRDGRTAGGEPGGGIHNSGTLKLIDLVVSGNQTGVGRNGTTVFDYGSPGENGGSGGGIWNSGKFTATRCSFTSNTTGKGGTGGYGRLTCGSGGSGGYGGGICNNGLMSLTDCTVSNNVCGDGGNSGAGGQNSGGNGGGGGWGGGIYTVNSVIIGCTIVSNRAGLGAAGGSGFSGGNGGGGGWGGGIYGYGFLVLTNCTVVGNSAGDGGEGGSYSVYLGSGGNGGSGGGICSIGATQNMAACTILENAAGTRGPDGHDGPFFFGVPSTDGRGGGIAVYVPGGNLLNTMVALNAGEGQDIWGEFSSLGHNLIGTTNGGNWLTAPGDLAGSDASPIDPKVAPLADNGGPTMTLALMPGSPAIDAGATFGSPATDQRGVTRPQGRGIDVGAYEFQSTTPGITDARFLSRSKFWLRAWGLPNQTYTFQISTDLRDWSEGTNVLTGSDGMCEYVDCGLSDRSERFYRLQLLSP